ncbi:N-acetylglucosaminyltransferase, partial [Tritonibacter sp. SIMBA_163]
IVQEFQWSRSLLTIFLQYSPSSVMRLSVRHRIQFVVCQLCYPLLAGSMALMFVFPIPALLFDVGYVDDTFPALVG